MDLCPPCQRDLPALGHQCQRCAEPLNAPSLTLCQRCLQSPPAFTSVIAPWHYSFPLSPLITGFKFSGQLSYGRVLGHLWIEHLRASADARADVLMPVPLHPNRLRQRGFNQTQLLAARAGRALGISVDSRSLQRIRDTTAQSSLDAEQRADNLLDAFVYRPRGTAPRHVAIIDDVITTGSTAHAIAQTLRDAGVQRISVWCLARAGQVW